MDILAEGDERGYGDIAESRDNSLAVLDAVGFHEMREALRDIVEFCNDPEGSDKPETLAEGLARMLPRASAALARTAA